MLKWHFSYDMTLEFSAAIFGTEKEFELSHLETCEVCAGTGAKVGSKMRICSTCGGRGQVMRTEQTPFGMFSQVIIMSYYYCLLLIIWLVFANDPKNELGVVVGHSNLVSIATENSKNEIHD